MTEQTQKPGEERAIVVDDVSYVISELPARIQNAVAQHDEWSADHREAQKKFAQLDAALRFLGGQIAQAVKEHVESGDEVPTVVAEDPTPEQEAAAKAALDVPADDV